MALTPREFLDAVRAQQGPDALNDRPALGLAVRFLPGHHAGKRDSLHAPSMLVYPCVDPVLEAHMMVAGATRRGAMSFQVGTGDDSPIAGIARMLEHTHPGIVVPEGWAYTSKGPKALADASYYSYQWGQGMNYRRDPVAALFQRSAGRHTARNPYIPAHWGQDPAPSSATSGVITWGAGANAVFFKVFTNGLALPAELVSEVGAVDLNLRPAGRSRRDPKPVRPAVAVAIAEWAADLGLALVDPDGDDALATARRRLSRNVVAWTRPGRPAQAQVSVGSRVELPAGVSVAVDGTRPGTVAPASRIGLVDAAGLAALARSGVSVTMPRTVADVAALAAAAPVDDQRLRPFQRVAVGRHVATEVGYVNLCPPGAGKSVMVLDGMRRRAQRISPYRGLVVCEANVRKQFSGEAATWFPEATVVTVESTRDAAALADALDAAGDSPVVVFTSYALACSVNEHISAEVDVERAIAAMLGGPERADIGEDDAPAPAVESPAPLEATSAATVTVTVAAPVDEGGQCALLSDDGTIPTALAAAVETADVTPDLGQLLLGVHWHDLVADEAAFLRNHTSKQARALWALRGTADVAVALTGTPINKGVDDLGRILAWARDDRHMFDGVRLENSFDLSTADGAADFADAIGPIVVRFDKSEWVDDLPDFAAPLVLELEPTAAELRLAEAARHELRRVYDELVAWMAQVEAANPGDDAYRQAREALQAARGAWLGGTTLARMAASDPAALLDSGSAGAALLASQGLVQAANAQAGTKRTAIVRMCAEKVAAGERWLIFTEFASVARGLIEDLRASGLRVGEILGGGGRRRDAHVEAFARGELDVMVATSAGERGLNLQTATTLVHYDLPWTPSGIIQRTGRIERIGATAASIQVIFPVMKGTIEERVVALVMSRAAAAAAAARALDSGSASGGRTEFDRAVGGLMELADSTLLSGKEAALLEATRAMLA